MNDFDREILGLIIAREIGLALAGVLEERHREISELLEACNLDNIVLPSDE